MRDLAILEMPPQTEATVSYRIGGTDAIQPGEPVITLGYPHAETGRFVLVQQPKCGRGSHRDGQSGHQE